MAREAVAAEAMLVMGEEESVEAGMWGGAYAY